MPDTQLMHIERAAADYASARENLNSTVDIIHSQIDAIHKRFSKNVKRLALITAEKHKALSDLIDGAGHLFIKPRTYVFNGIKVGLQKQRGSVEIKDPAKVILLIKKNFRDQADNLINTKETPDKKALEKLPAADLKRLGIEISKDTDAIVITPVEDTLDKLVNAFLKQIESVDGEEEQKAA